MKKTNKIKEIREKLSFIILATSEILDDLEKLEVK